mgnify:CR=1 FL=1
MFETYVIPGLIILLQTLVLLVALLVFTAFILYADRKIWAAVQSRRGPNVVGPWGLLQSFADLLKFVLKEPIVPSGSNKGIFLLAPFVLAWYRLDYLRESGAQMTYVRALLSKPFLLAGVTTVLVYAAANNVFFGGLDGLIRHFTWGGDVYAYRLDRSLLPSS